MNDKVFSTYDTTADSPEWNDWRWQVANRITDIEGLERVITLSEQEREGIRLCLDRFRMAITPYFASLLDPDDPGCPLRRQVIPSADETVVMPWEGADPLDEEGSSPVPNLVHRYPDRVLFSVTRRCSLYCRYCIRKRYVGEEDFAISAAERDTALRYIAATPQVRDVLISGGDPLTMGDDELEDIVARVRAIDTVEVIRIGTRVPAVLPMRITAGLLEMLKQYHPLWINVHFNHPSELTPEAVEALGAIADAGIPLGNQSVLLKGVNDDVETMRELLLGLVRARVRPYYLYQCDPCEGTNHFRTRVEVGIELLRELTGQISGFAIPRFVVDAPGGGGKVPLGPQNLLSIDEEKAVLVNYEGKVIEYPQPSE